MSPTNEVRDPRQAGTRSSIKNVAPSNMDGQPLLRDPWRLAVRLTLPMHSDIPPDA
jgi:hypothetical protein